MTNIIPESRRANSVYYLSGMPNSPAELLSVAKQLRREIVNSGLEFNSIAVRGMSGAVVAPILSLQFRKPLSLIRKPRFTNEGVPETEDSHSSRKVEGWIGGGPYIIVDDLIDTGATIDAIVDSMMGAWKEAVQAELAARLYFSNRTGKWLTQTERSLLSVEKFLPHAPVCVGIFLHNEFRNSPYSAGAYTIPCFCTCDF